MPEKIRTLVTHSGTFHPDEVMASVVLSRLYPEAIIVRTREPDLVSMPSPDTIIYDVGMAYDPEQLCFDHHQADAPVRRDGTRYSAFGLVWKHFGLDYLEAVNVPPEHREKAWEAIDKSIVRSIDLGDNGQLPDVKYGSPDHLVRSTELGAIMDALNPSGSGVTPERRRKAFDTAMDVCTGFFDGAIDHLAHKLAARERIAELIEAQRGSPILVLDVNAPYDGVIRTCRADHVRFIIHPREDEWIVKGMLSSAGSYDVMLELPESWAGLDGAALEEVSGIEGGVFCHRGRWMAINKTLDGAVAMATKALDLDIVPDPC